MSCMILGDEIVKVQNEIIVVEFDEDWPVALKGSQGRQCNLKIYRVPIAAWSYELFSELEAYMEE